MISIFRFVAGCSSGLLRRHGAKPSRILRIGLFLALDPLTLHPLSWAQPQPALSLQDSESATDSGPVSPAGAKAVTLPEEELGVLDDILVEPEWTPGFHRETGLGLWDCILLAMENNRPLRNARDDLRIANITLEERHEEFQNIYFLGAGAHYDENGAPAPFALSEGPLSRDRYSFTFGGLDSDGSFLTRRFYQGGSLSLGAQSVYNSQTATRIRPFVVEKGEPISASHLQDVRWFSEANLVVTQPLLEGAGDVATTGLRIQELEQSIQNLSLEREIQFLINSVIRDYLRVQLQISLTDVGRQSYERAIEQFNITRQKVGKLREVELLNLVRAKQQITTTQQQLIDIKNDVDSSLIDLRLTLGLEPDRAIVLSGTEIPEVAPPQMPLEAVIEDGLRHRPDLRALDLAVQQAEIAFESARNALLPNLDFSARMRIREQDDDFLEAWESLAYEDVGADLTLSLPLNLPSDQANFERAQIILRQAITTYEQFFRVVTNEIDEAYRAQQTLLRRVEILRLNEILARDTFEKLLGQAEGGLRVDPFDVVRAQDDWTNASAERVRAEINYVIVKAALDLAMGAPISQLFALYAPPDASLPPR